MLRRIVLASAGSIAVSGAALAADLGVQAPRPFYVPLPPAWTGFYLGVDAGGTWTSSKAVDTVAGPGACGCLLTPTFSSTGAALATFSASPSTGEFIGGGQIGYNYQFGRTWVAGVETDIQGLAGATSSAAFNGALANPNFPTIPISETANVTRHVDYLGTLRARLGILAVPTLLIYGTAGLAYGEVTASTSITQEVAVTLPAFSSGNLNNTHAGWTAGAGIEWMFLPNWSVKGEYLYYDLGSLSYNLSPLVATSTNTGILLLNSFPQSSTRFTGNIVRAGLSYHYNWSPPPIFAKY